MQSNNVTRRKCVGRNSTSGLPRLTAKCPEEGKCFAEILDFAAAMDKLVFGGLLWIMETGGPGVNRLAIWGFAHDARVSLFLTISRHARDVPTTTDRRRHDAVKSRYNISRGRYGFDGSCSGWKACRTPPVRNRVEIVNCEYTVSSRCLIKN